jgi:hypothetical protein
MALKTLKDVKEIGGFKIKHIDNRLVGSEFNEALEKEYFIFDNAENNSLSFIIQNGAIKENGVNGCQVDTVIETAKVIVEGLNKNFPCKQNKMVIAHLQKALEHLAERKADREERGVEGYEKA